jgi:hypothetical protein
MLVLATTALGTPSATERTASRVTVPNVGYRLDPATRTLHKKRLRVNEECNGLFGCIVKSRWVVCDQDPRAGARVRSLSIVVVYADRPGRC